ncbi:MAG: DsbA family protein [Actinomycetota bacterium]|nr:DsbA family protein [Actinomycetota bacterium]
MPGASLSPPLDPDDHIDGNADAPLALVVYGDFQCPYCVAAQSMIRRARDQLGGRLRYAFRHMPISERHPYAPKAAEAAEAAAAQGAFWPMHDRLYAARGRLAVDDLVGHASALGLDVDRVRSELADGVHEARVARDYESALASGVRGTPAFFTNGVHHEGAFDAGSLIEALEATAPAPARD